MYKTVQDVADVLRIHPRTLRRMIQRGELAAVKVGKEWRIPGNALDHLLSSQGNFYRNHLFMTTDEFLQLPEDSLPTQLIRGYVVRDPAPFVPHQMLVGRLYISLHRAIVETGQGIVLLSPTDVVLSDDTVLQPDLLAVSKDRLPIIGKRVEGPPDLVIEVESEHTRERDMTVKRMLYAQYGVRELWYVSGSSRSIIQMTDPADGDYRTKSVHTIPAAVTSSMFPGLNVGLAQLLEGY